MNRPVIIMLAIVTLGLGMHPAFGAEDEADMRLLMERIGSLESKNAELERRSNLLKPSTSQELDSAISREEATAASVSSSRAIKIGGYVDVSYQYNFNRPDNQNNNLRAFDTDSNGFNVHQAQLDFDALPTRPGEVGFRLDILYGNDARLIKAQDNVAAQLDKHFGYYDNDFKQAYISYIVPLPGCESCGTKKGVTLDFGKFVTWAGYETIEAADNMNSSRSFLFGYAIPFTHTGIRATYDVFKCDESKWTLGAAIYNGWDNTQDQNRSKTYALHSEWKANKWFEWDATVIAGVEDFVDERTTYFTAINSINGADPTDPATPGFGSLSTGNTVLGALDNGRDVRFFDPKDGNAARYLLDSTFIIKPWCGKDDFVLALNGDFASQRGGKWYGAAAYAKWQFAKNWYVAMRGEYFNDPNGLRTGIREQLYEGTATLNWQLAEPLATRLEFRSDSSNRYVFSNTHGVGNAGPDLSRPFGSKRQNTLMHSWLYKF